jgi:G protein-coupled receptor 153
LYPHFPLTDFEREPHALRRLSQHGRSCSRGGSPDGSHRADRACGGESSGACRSGSLREHRRDGKRHGELVPAGQSLRTGEHSSHRPSRTGAHRAGPDWGGHKHLTTGDSKGSTNSFISSPSASASGYITFHSDSIGSAT